MTADFTEQDSAYGVSEHPTFVEVFRILQRSIELGIHTGLPATVTKYTPAVQGQTPAMVDLQPSMAAVYISAGGRELPPKPLPIIYGALVGTWATGGFKQTAEPLPGDSGWIFFGERSLEAWRKSGGAPLPPPFSHTHSMSDAVWYPIVRPGPTPTMIEPGKLFLGTNTGSPVEPGELSFDLAGNAMLEGPSIKLGRTAVAPNGQLALAQALHTYLVQLITAGVPTATDGGAGLKTTMLAFLASSPFTAFATTKTVAE